MTPPVKPPRTASADIPSPIDFHDSAQVATWVESTIANRPSRPRFFAAFVAALNAHFKRSFSVLELGSGPGHLAEQILSGCDVTRYVALDFSQAMHDLARERLTAFLNRVEFIRRDFRGTWGEGLGLFDAVVTMQAAHEVRHKRHVPELLARTHLQIAPGGLLLFSDHFSEEGSAKVPELYFTREEQPRALEKAGFADVRELHVEGGMALFAAARR